MNRLLLLIFLLANLTAKGQTVQLSPTAEVSIITCGPWQEEVYSAFGHSAIRVYDSLRQIDYIYNYGVFDFNQPNFYLNYTRGLLNFKLGVYPYPDFRDIYIYYNRSVTEQVLNLSAPQKQSLYDYLEWNALPENETYRYDYFYNNCASKVRDVFRDVLKDSIRFDSSFIKTDYTIRQLTDIYLTKQPWGDLGIDICLGLPMDKKAAPFEYMFLPDYIESSFDHVTINQNGTFVPLVRSKVHVYEHRPEKSQVQWFQPWTVLGAFLAVTFALSVYDWRRKNLSKWFDIILFGVTGAVGSLLLLLWTATDHQAAAKNFNLLWALPTHLFVFVIFRKKSATFLKKYFLGISVLTSLLLVSWFFLPQQLNIFLIPFVGAVLCRAITISKLLGPVK